MVTVCDHIEGKELNKGNELPGNKPDDGIRVGLRNDVGFREVTAVLFFEAAQYCYNGQAGSENNRCFKHGVKAPVISQD